MEPSIDTVWTATPRTAWLARVVLLLVAAAAVVAGFGLTRPRQVAPYVCPMHAEIRAAAPGACPICGMALERGADARFGAEVARPAFAVTAPELVTVRSRVFSREVRAAARVERGGTEVVALVHSDDLDPARTEEGGIFTPADGAAPAPVEATSAPPSAADDATSWVRFRVRGGPLAAREVSGWVSWPARPRPTLVLPDTAIVRDADGPYVLVAVPGAPLGFEKRPVKVGKTFQSLGVVVSGLAPGERVVADGAFSWDAERRRRAAGPPARAP